MKTHVEYVYKDRSCICREELRESSPEVRRFLSEYKDLCNRHGLFITRWCSEMGGLEIDELQGRKLVLVAETESVENDILQLTEEADVRLFSEPNEPPVEKE